MHNYDERGTFKTVVSFLGKLFSMGCRGTLTLASKSLFLKHEEGSTQHETLLVGGPPLLSCLLGRTMMAAHQRCYCKHELSKNLLFSKLCVHKQCSQCLCSCVETLVMLRAKFHVVLSLLSLAISDSVLDFVTMLACQCPMHYNENGKGLTHIQSQIKSWLLSGESFTLRKPNLFFLVANVNLCEWRTSL